MKETRQKWPHNMNPSTGYSGKGKTIKVMKYSDQWLLLAKVKHGSGDFTCH